MANMSYCRFANTANDLEDCVCALEEIMDEERNDLDIYESRGAKRMRKLCERYIELFDDLEEGDLI